MISLKQVATYRGPNPLSTDPVIVVEIEISKNVEGEAVRYAHVMSDACSDWFSFSEPTDSISPLELAGKFLTSWSLAALTHIRGYLHSGGAKLHGERLLAWLGFHDERLSYRAIELAAELFVKLGSGQIDSSKVGEPLQALWALCRRIHPDYQARILMGGARKHSIPVLPYLEQARLWQYGWGRRAEVFIESSPRSDSLIGASVSRDKLSSKALCTALGLPVAPHVLVTSSDQLAAAIRTVGLPCVAKPVDGSQGRGVTADIKSLSAAQTAFQEAKKFTKNPIMIEAHIAGADYRLMVIRSKFAGAFRRKHPSVTGDGKKTIQQLIADINQQRSSNMVKSRYLSPIALDSALKSTLAAQGFTLDVVLKADRTIPLRRNANRSTGGTCFDETGLAHKDVRAMAEALARATGIDSLGIDYLTKDIGKPPKEGGGAIIEFNKSPGLGVMIAAGMDSDAVGALILGDKPGRIPTTILLAKTEALKTAKKFMPLQNDAGWVCQQEAWIGGLPLETSNAQLFELVQVILRHPSASSLLVAADSETISREGLPLDRFDRAVLCDLRLDPQWRAVVDECCSEVIETENLEHSVAFWGRAASALQ
jgi:cyanophycin synthetase